MSRPGLEAYGLTRHICCSKVCKKCDIDLNKRAGELTTDEVNKIVAVVSKPLEFKIPSWMLNRNRDVKDGKTSQKYANFLDQALREDARRSTSNSVRVSNKSDIAQMLGMEVADTVRVTVIFDTVLATAISAFLLQAS